MLEYLKEHILDEIDGANDYMMKAVEKKGTPCGETFRVLAEAETQHANHLYHIFSKHEKPEDMPEARYSEMLKSILDKYSTGMAKFEALKKLYWS